jgi:hypothetical protein
VKIFGWTADEDGCGKYRVMQPLDALAARGHQVRYGGQMSAWGREVAEIIIAQRSCMPGPTSLLPTLKAQGKRIVFEVDDNLFAVDPRNNVNWSFWAYPWVRENLTTNIKLADLVTCTVEPLAEVLRKLNPNVVVLPNAIRSDLLDVPLPIRRGQRDGVTVLGWQGSPTHANDWAIVRPHVAEAMEADHGVRVRFLGTWYLGGLPVDPTRIDIMRWTKDLDAHYKRITKFDIGLAPLQDTKFNLSKSGIRAVEYMALGVPGIYSGVPAYAAVVEDGVTGLVARSSDQWRKHIHDLVNDPARRVEIGDRARKAARAWTFEERAAAWEAAYASIL